MAKIHLHLGLRQEQQCIILLEMPTIIQNDFSGLCDVLDFYFSSLRNILLLPLSLSSRHIQIRSYILLIYILESVASLVRKLCA